MRGPRGDRPQKPAPRNATEAVQRLDEIETQIDELRKGIGYLSPQPISEQKPTSGQVWAWDASRGLMVPSSMAGLAASNWKIFYSNGSGAVTELSLGTSGTFLKANGASSAPTFETPSGMKKTANAGYYTLPASPDANGASFTAGNGSFSAYQEVRSASGAALYIVGARVTIEIGETSAPAGFDLSIGTGAASSETEVGQWPFGGAEPGTDMGINGISVAFPFPIPVAASTRIAVRASCNTATTTVQVTLVVIDQANLVDA